MINAQGLAYLFIHTYSKKKKISLLGHADACVYMYIGVRTRKNAQLLCERVLILILNSLF